MPFASCLLAYGFCLVDDLVFTVCCLVVLLVGWCFCFSGCLCWILCCACLIILISGCLLDYLLLGLRSLAVTCVSDEFDDIEF